MNPTSLPELPELSTTRKNSPRTQKEDTHLLQLSEEEEEAQQEEEEDLGSSHNFFWIRVLVGLFGFMLCSSGKEGGCEWSVGCASPTNHESRPSHPNIHRHP